jgi:Domain of unknown function (DUF929)
MADPTRKPPPRKAGSGQRRKPAAAPIDPEKVAAAKAARRAEAEAAAARKAAEAARLARKKRQRTLTYVAIGLVVVVVAGLIAVKVVHKAAPDTASGVQNADPAVVAQITAIPVSVLDRVGDGGFMPGFNLTSGDPPPLVSGGLPRVLYVGGLFCPFCATERWPMIAALSRFGAFKGLRYARSATQGETVKDIRTFSLSGVTYTSTYLAFTPYETTDRNHKALDTLPAADTTLVSTLDNQPTLPSGTTSGTIPFVDIANRWVLAGASYNATDLEGKDWAQIASAATSGTGIGRQLDATANWITAALCAVTANKPASVCSDPVIAGLEKRLPVQ